MKKLIHTLLISLFMGLSLMPMQSVSAATLKLESNFGGSVQTGSGSTVSGDALGSSFLGLSLWTLEVGSDTELTFNLSSNIANMDSFMTGIFDNSGFIPPPVFGFMGSTVSAFFTAGTYFLQVFPGFGNIGLPYSLSVTAVDPVSDVPVPAAVWLFGSAVAGLMGGLRRKAKLAAA